ncbi:bifunctional diaminohydroxyphosphoribosylaminopyrimidine deaminase/5-amino-6-(5-phosphoribosylamino)uracil reductase RibD [Dongia rigui]|uniref:Riboflavin biosynthesis protein RibD n=2 Tax=Dongia rigui TaxID=940149 RepID=A0ABU5E1K3_9PROT|nr:bifunctional diaminohydroxyphosphoribosylaminopyrimidine deaminase/5-amino-6-(5-phosphoribosylamino)uracil reductase RibD [Dongia rigui]MDY0873080.1 bifunctional diaminohydroxyphosphoribosylaminopyrimidine deaminase/5-amino-6-(5-phosphoribosylamino)uracil reductase RibD [Dongia rigui]
MSAALGLGRRNLGRTWPNPSVGCVIVKDGRVVGRGYTQPGGRPHAETQALVQAGSEARGATAYVTLEPCAHHGKTPPCAEALVAAGIQRCVIATGDPDPRVAGGGIAILKAAGIEITEGVLEAEARESNAGFFTRIKLGRPLVTLKLATTLDGRIATLSGESKWITGPGARAAGHQLRATHDAIMVGSGTVLADDPELTCRLPGLEDRSPIRIVLDTRLRIPPTAKLLADQDRFPTWVVTKPGHPARPEMSNLLHVEGSDSARLRSVLMELGARGLTRVLVEGGATLATNLLKEDLVDRIAWFQAPFVIGNDGMAGIGELGRGELDRISRFKLLSEQRVGPDSVALYSRPDCGIG